MPYLMIIAATFLWGFGFIATKWALTAVGPLWLTAIRYVLAWLTMLIFLKLYRKSSSELLIAESLHVKRWALICGLLLAGLMVFQTVGLVFTTATNSAFLTTLYAVIVPFICVVAFKVRLRLVYWVALTMAMVGVVMLCGFSMQPGEGFNFNRGDLYTVVGSVFAAAHIIGLEIFTRRPASISRFNMYQYFVTAFAVLPFAVLFESAPKTDLLLLSPLALWGIAFLAIPSTVVSFTLQTVAQKHLPSTTASLGLLLESPFALLFAYLLLGERLSLTQITGSVLVLVSSIIVVVPEMLKRREVPDSLESIPGS